MVQFETKRAWYLRWDSNKLFKFKLKPNGGTRPVWFQFLASKRTNPTSLKVELSLPSIECPEALPAIHAVEAFFVLEGAPCCGAFGRIWAPDAEAVGAVEVARAGRACVAVCLALEQVAWHLHHLEALEEKRIAELHSRWFRERGFSKSFLCYN